MLVLSFLYLRWGPTPSARAVAPVGGAAFKLTTFRSVGNL
jgi:hypothetical protein